MTEETKRDVKRRMPVRTSPIEIGAPYTGWRATVRTNMPIRDYNRIFVGQGRFEALAEIVQEWNFVGDDGEPIPITAEGMQALGFDLLQMLIREIDEAVARPLASEQ